MKATPTPEELALLDNHVVLMRAICGDFSKLMNKMNAIDQSWKANVNAIVATPGGVKLNDSSGLAGKTQLTDTQVASMMTSFEAVLTSYYTPAVQQVLVLYCGAGNLM